MSEEMIGLLRDDIANIHSDIAAMEYVLKYSRENGLMSLSSHLRKRLNEKYRILNMLNKDLSLLMINKKKGGDE
jgi:hypothetical protein